MWVNGQSVGCKRVALHLGFSETTLAHPNYLIIDLKGVVAQAPDVVAFVFFRGFYSTEYFTAGLMQGLN